MIATNLGLYSIEETVTRPVLVTVTKDILNFLGLTNDIHTVFDPKDGLKKTMNKLGTLTAQLSAFDEVVKVEYVDSSAENNDLSLVPVNPDHIPIFNDNEIDSSCVPVYHKRKLAISFKYFSKSQSKVNMIVNKLRLTTSTDSMYKIHDLEYSFLLHNTFLKLLIDIVRLKNIRLSAAEQLTFTSYINNTFDNRIDFLNRLDGSLDKRDMVIREVQKGVVGYITDDLHNLTAEEDEANNMFGVVFNYEFVYEKPVALRLKYPLLVYNTPIAKEFRTFIKDTPTETYGVRTQGSSGMASITNTDNSKLRIGDNKYCLTIPAEDSMLLPKPQSNTARLMSVMILVDPDNPTELLNVRDGIPGIKFKENILAFLLDSERPFINDLFHSCFYFELYKNNKRDQELKLVLDEFGNLTTTGPMDVKAVYRVVFNFIVDMAVLFKDAKARLKKFLMEELERLRLLEKIENKTLTSDYNLLIREYPELAKLAKDLASFLEHYITLFGISVTEITDGLRKTRYEDVVFNIKEPYWTSYFTKETVINLTGFMEER